MISPRKRYEVLRLAARFAVIVLTIAAVLPAMAAGRVSPPTFKVLPPIVHGNLALFPVVAKSYDTSSLLTLDEGTRSGQVTISEKGEQPAMVHPGQQRPFAHTGPEVNRLLLYNNSDRPLLLLAGEIVTGGKQDRVIGSDRIVPPKSGPVDLSVFCVEPGRWTGATPVFGSLGEQMAQPEVRAPAMADKNQQAVWDSVRSSNAQVARSLAAPIAGELHGTTSYAKVFGSRPVQQAIEQYGGANGQQTTLTELKKTGSVGVVVAVNGQLLWADLFASTDLLSRYWAKLNNSYIAEALTRPSGGAAPSVVSAESWINAVSGTREVSETEPGVYRRTDITGDGYRVFKLTSFSPAIAPVHLTKITQQQQAYSSPVIR